MKKSRILKGLSVLVVGVMLAVDVGAVKAVGDEGMERGREMRERYVRDVRDYREVRRGILQEGEKVRELKEREGELKGVALEKIKARVLQALDRVLGYMDRARQRWQVRDVQGREEWEQEWKKDREWLITKRSEVEQAGSVEELRQVWREVKQRWQEVRRRTRRVLGRVAMRRFERVIVRLENAGVKVSKAMEAMKAEGKDTAKAEELYGVFEAKLENLKSVYEEVRHESENNWQARDAAAKKVHAAVRETYQALKAVIKELKSL